MACLHYTHPVYILKREIGFILFLTILFSACSTLGTSGSLSGRTKQDFTFQSSQSIYVPLPEPQTATAKEFRNLLVSEMRRAGLTVTEELTEDSLLLFFKTNNETQNIIRIPGNPAISRLPSQWQEIFLELYIVKDVEEPGPVWEGYLKIPIKRFNAQPGNSLRPLLDLVGKNYEGPLPITVYTKTEPSPKQEEIERLEEKVKSLEEKIEKLEPPSEPSDPSGKGSTTTGESP